MNINDIKRRIDSGELWFKCASDDSYVIRAESNGSKFFIKIEGMEEFECKQNSSLLTDAFLQIEFITKKQYEDFQ